MFRIPTIGQPVYILADEAHGRLYVSHPMNNVVSVVDTVKRVVTSYIEVGAYPGFVSLNVTEQILVTANYADSSLSIVDLARDHRIHTIATGRHPRHVAIASSGNLIGSCNTGGDSITLVRFTNGRLEETTEILVGKEPEEILFSVNRDLAYVLCRADRSLYIVDTHSKCVNCVTDLKFELGHRPAALCLSSSTNRLFVACSSSGQVHVLGEMGESIGLLSVGTVPISIYALASAPWICVLDSVEACVYLIDSVSLEVIHSIAVGAVPLTVAEMSARSLLVVISFESQTASLIDLSSCMELERVPLARRPFGPAAIDSLNTVFIASEDEGCILGYTIEPKMGS